MRTKPSVSLWGADRRLVGILGIVENAFSAQGKECVVTSATEGKHIKGSLHPSGLALDFRGRDCTLEELRRIRDRIEEVLGPDWDVIVEIPADLNKRHIHIEYDPK